MCMSKIEHHLLAFSVGLVIAGCVPERRQTMAPPDGQEAVRNTPDDPSLADPVVVRGSTIEEAMNELAKQLRGSFDGPAADFPLMLDTFRGTNNRRTEMDSYLEIRLIEAMQTMELLMLPRTDDQDLALGAIRETHAGTVAVQDRIEYGHKRGAQCLINGKTTWKSTHLELALSAINLQDGTNMLSSRVELQRDDDLVRMSQTQLVSLEDMQAGRVPDSVREDANSFRIEAEPLQLTFRVEAAKYKRDEVCHDNYVALSDNGVMHDGDCFAVSFRTNRDCYVYGILHSADGMGQTFFPYEGVNLSNRIKGNREYRIPDDKTKGYWLDPPAGQETVYLIASDEPLEDIEQLAEKLRGGARLGDAGRRVLGKLDKSRTKNHYVARPGTKGIGGLSRNEDAPSQNATPDASRFQASLEGLGLVYKTLKIDHR